MKSEHNEKSPAEVADIASDEDLSADGSYASMILPVVTSIALVTLFFVFAGGDAALELVTTAIATATVLGKFVVLRGLHEEGFFDSPYKLAVLVVYLDIATATIAVYNVGLLHKIPRLGKRIRAMQDNGQDILGRNPWMRKVTFFGIIAFVMFPLSGTGAIGGALMGRLLGMSRLRTMVGIVIGAVLGSFSMAALAQFFGDKLSNLQGSPAFVFGGVAVVAGVIYWLYRRLSSAAPPTE